jgi:hypothetical protein
MRTLCRSALILAQQPQHEYHLEFSDEGSCMFLLIYRARRMNLDFNPGGPIFLESRCWPGAQYRRQSLRITGRSRRTGSLALLPGSRGLNWRNGANWMGDVTLRFPCSTGGFAVGPHVHRPRCPVPTARSGEPISPLLRRFTRIHAATFIQRETCREMRRESNNTPHCGV